MYVKGSVYPVTVTDVDDSGFLVKDHKGELLDFTLKDLGRVILFSKGDDIYKFQDTDEYLAFVQKCNQQTFQTLTKEESSAEKICPDCEAYEMDCWGRDKICPSFKHKYVISSEERKNWTGSSGGYAGNTLQSYESDIRDIAKNRSDEQLNKFLVDGVTFRIADYEHIQKTLVSIYI